MDTLQPLHGRVLVREIETEAKTKSGIVLSHAVRTDAFQRGVVVSVSKGEDKFKVGDTLVYQPYGNTEIEGAGGAKFLLLEANQICAIERK